MLPLILVSVPVTVYKLVNPNHIQPIKCILTSSSFRLPLTVNEMKLTCPGNCRLHHHHHPPPTITLERFGDYVCKKISLAQSHRSGFMPSN